MILKRRSVLLRVTLLVLVPLVFLIGLYAYDVTSSVRGALVLIRSKVMMTDLGHPMARLQRALTGERAQMIVYYARPGPAALAALRGQQVIADRAVVSFETATNSAAVRQDASAGGKKAITALRKDLARLPALRVGIADQSISGQRAFAAYNGMIAASYQVLEQAIIQEGNSTQELPKIAVIELAISNEYLQQESALLDANFAVRAFPPGSYQAFVRLVGAHRLLYVQSYSYLDHADRSDLNRDVSPRVAHTVAALENKIVASDSPSGAPPVRAVTWNGAVATLSAQVQRAVGQAEARLVAGARSQADATLRRLYLTGGIGLAAVIASLLLSLWIAVKLARQLHALRDSALDMANVRLPAVVRRLRAGEDVDVAAQVPRLDASADEIGQVKAAFNAAQRTAVEAAVDQARLRRGINDVFRNLARRSQSLLERQLTLLDMLERRADAPEDLENLFRIDHLTTRMRRHAESLIVLAGDQPERAFLDPVRLVDVLRAAVAEVEDYTRIRVAARTPAALAGPAVADVIHMLAELVENATTFSPPATEVRVTGTLVAKGYAIDIEDRGLGMTEAGIAAVNASLAEPPMFDLSGSDRLGLFVAAQLARRHGIRVTLRESPYGGVTAVVLIPLQLLVPADGPTAAAVPALVTAPANGAVSGNGAAARSAPATGAVSGHGAARSAPASDQPQPGRSPLEPAEDGLPQRVRQMSLAPQLRTSAYSTEPGGAAEPSRSPEAAHGMMSAFRRGWQRGLSDPDREQDQRADLSRDGESR